MNTLPNGKSIDREMIGMALEDTDLSHRYFLNLETGEVIPFSDDYDITGEDEEIESNRSNYVAVEPRIASHEAYQWMADFINDMVAPADKKAAEKLSTALDGKGAFRRFKDTLQRVDERWQQEWYQWKEKQLAAVIDAWLEENLS